MPDPLGAALDAMMDNHARATRWLGEIEDERRRAIDEVERLRAAIHATAELMPADQRARRKALLHRMAPGAGRPGPPIGRTERMAAVLHVLAHHPAATIRVGELQRYLSANALAKDSRAAARILAKKARQGIVERVDWGTYRIAADHPALVEVRRS